MKNSDVVIKVMYEMVKNVVSFTLYRKIVDFRVLPLGVLDGTV